MKITLDIDDDVLEAAKELARREGVTIARVISSLARRSLAAPRDVPIESSSSVHQGIPILAPRGEVITPEHIEALMDTEDDPATDESTIKQGFPR
jgi:antitoxin component of RelBE/YafQ-DinJ toxin-antitoxin module